MNDLNLSRWMRDNTLASAVVDYRAETVFRAMTKRYCGSLKEIQSETRDLTRRQTQEVIEAFISEGVVEVTFENWPSGYSDKRPTYRLANEDIYERDMSLAEYVKALKEVQENE